MLQLHIIVLYHDLIHKARTHFNYFPWRKTPGSRPLEPRFQLRRRKYRYSGEFGEFHHLLPGEGRCILNPGSRRNGGFVRFYGEFGSLRGAPGARCPAGTYPQVVNKIITYGEFGSLKALDTGLGPRCAPRITRALGPGSFGLGPRPMSRETI